jgi:hypothetical protein
MSKQLSKRHVWAARWTGAAAALVLTSASGLAQPAPAPAPAPPGVAAMLRQEVGGPVLLVLDQTGIEAVSVDGSHHHTLVAGHVQQAVYRPELDLLWFRLGDQLEVLDLRAAEARPVVVTGKLGPFGVIVDLGGQSVELADRSEYARVKIGGGSAPKLEGENIVDVWHLCGGDPMGGVEPEPRCSKRAATKAKAETSRASKVKLTGAAWLKGQATRAPRADPPATAEFSKPAQPVLSAGQCRCEDHGGGQCAGGEAELCGAVSALPATAWVRVVVGMDVTNMCEGGDCRSYECVLFDPGTGKFSQPETTRVWDTFDKVKPAGCEIGPLDASGRAFVEAGHVYVLGGDVREVKGELIGWLDPGPTLGAPAGAGM